VVKIAADFSWIEYNATAGDTSVPTNLNLGSTNAADLAPSTYPITAGTYSYSKWIKGHWSGSFTRIENLQFWMSSSGTGYVPGEHLLCSATTSDYAGTDTYVTPTNSADAQAANAMPEADPGAANIGIGGSLTGSLEATGDSDFIVIQASIESSADAGVTQQKEFRLQYDEV
jgi:hypothetical protein